VGSAIPRRCPRVPVHHLGCGEGQPFAPVLHGAGREQLAAIGWDREGKLILTSSPVKLVPRLGVPVHGGSSGRLCQQGLQKSMVSSLTPASVLTLSE
jgi:hypothetical protein